MANRFPEHGMIGVAAAIIAHRIFDVRRNCVEITDELLDGFGFEVRFACDVFVLIRHVSVVMFVVMDFHRLRVDVRFESVFRIRKWW